MKKSELNPLSQDNNSAAQGSKHREHDPQLHQQVSSLLQRIQRLRRQSGPAETMDYQTLRQQYEVAANREVRQLQHEAQQHRIERLIAQADLNPEWLFERMDHDDPTLEYAIQTARSFISGFEHWEQHGGSCVLIYGGYGTGKSTLAGAIAHELIAQHQKSVIFQQWASVVDRLFFGVIEDQEARNRYRRALEEVDLLIIDEIGSNRAKLLESQSSFLGHLLRRRRNLSKSVILITNHSPASLHQALGDFCFEAIKAFNPVDIQLIGPSRRPHVGSYQG
ncbi:MAG: ATP-binding protein [Aeromonadaceae bacterium]|nr:ATP-binding protein [Aeromonadaceae bacterium]